MVLAAEEEIGALAVDDDGLLGHVAVGDCHAVEKQRESIERFVRRLPHQASERARHFGMRLPLLAHRLIGAGLPGHRFD